MTKFCLCLINPLYYKGRGKVTQKRIYLLKLTHVRKSRFVSILEKSSSKWKKNGTNRLNKHR